jgi:transcriptional regulator with XRE-family HTH domain
MPHTVHMTQQVTPGNIPALTLGWRLRMALDYSNTSVQEMADTLGVARATLSRWMSDKGAHPKRAYISQWALKTGVPEEWLSTGRPPSERDPDGDGGALRPATLGGSPTDQYPRLLHPRLVHLPKLGLVTANTTLLPFPKFTASTLTRAAVAPAA